MMRRRECCRIMILLALAISIGFGCSTHHNQTVKQQKAIEKRMEEKRKQEQALYESKLKRHEKIQSAEGRKLIQQANDHRNQLDKQNGKKKFSLKKLFSEDEPTCK